MYKILVVEDELLVQDLLHDFMREVDYEVTLETRKMEGKR